MSVWLPMLSTERLARRDRRGRREDGAAAPGGTRALLLITTEGQRQVVARCCPRARDAGVRIGMALAQARALFPSEDGFRVLAFDGTGDRRVLRGLAVWAQRLAPIVGVEDPDERDGIASMTGVYAQGLTLDVSGCAHLFARDGADGETGMIRAAESGLRALGFTARAAIAPSLGCAWAVARFGDREACRARAIGTDGARRAIEPMPVAALGVDGATAQKLAEVGIERVGEVLAMPRGALAARFGEGLLLRIDRALGRGIETIEAVRPVPPPAVERVFEGPTDRVEAIEHTVRGLLGEVAAELARRVCGARRVVVELVRTDLDPEVLTVELGRPSRDARHLWALVRPKLERAHLGAAGFGVEGVRVGVPVVGRVEERQGLCARGAGVSGDDAARAGAELLDTLRNRLGEARVVRAEVVESHLPERAFAWRPAGTGRSRDGTGAQETARVTGMDRPTVLFDRPVPVEVWALTPDGPVHRLVWDGDVHAVTACVGPERIGGEWWREAERRRDRETQRRSGGDPGARECFRVRIESGAWVWVVRAMGSGRWFVCGWW